MDTPKKDAFDLLSFPPDIWAHLSLFLVGEQFSRLKMTGATALWRKLTRPGVVRSVVLGSDSLIFKSWPSFLSELSSLENLLIHAESCEFDLRLDMIPPSVKRLTCLNFRCSPKRFFVNKEKRALKLGVQLPQLEALNVALDGNYNWFKFCPSTLTALTMTEYDFRIVLPATLLSLTVSRIRLQDLVRGIHFPPLETITTSDVDYMDWLMTLLPRKLIRLYIRQGHFRDRRVSMSEFPRGLTHLQLPCLKTWSSILAKDTSSLSKLDPQQFSLLPPSLVYLAIEGGVPSSTWAYLPSGLQTFNFHVCHSHVRNTPKHLIKDDELEAFLAPCPLEKLPRSITSIGTFAFDDYNSTLWRPASNFISKNSEQKNSEPRSTSSTSIESSGPSYWPPHIAYLNIADIHLSPEAVSLLPDSLRTLSLRNLSAENSKHLPSGLTSLSATSTLMSPELISNLPKTLTTLSLKGVERDVYWYNHQTGEAIDSVRQIGDYAAHQNFGSKLNPKKVYSLPPRLTYLRLQGFPYIDDSFFAKQKFTHLLGLDIFNIPKISDQSIPFLNPNLTHLCISPAINISGKCFPSLPRSLTTLELNSSSEINDSDIRDLPRALKILKLKDAKHLTDDCIPDLPQHLENFYVAENENLNSSSLSQYPYSLRSPLSTCSIYTLRWRTYAGNVSSNYDGDEEDPYDAYYAYYDDYDESDEEDEEDEEDEGNEE